MKRKFSFFYFVLSSLQPAYYAVWREFSEMILKILQNRRRQIRQQPKIWHFEQGRFAHIKSRRIKAYWTVIRKAKSVTKWTSSTVKLLPLMTVEGLTLSKRVRLWFLPFQRQIKVGISGYGGKINHEKQQSYSTCITANLDKLESNKRNTAKICTQSRSTARQTAWRFTHMTKRASTQSP